MDERVHVVRLCFDENFHGDGLTLSDTILVENFICWVVIRMLHRIETVQTPRGDEDGSIG